MGMEKLLTKQELYDLLKEAEIKLLPLNHLPDCHDVVSAVRKDLVIAQLSLLRELTLEVYDQWIEQNYGTEDLARYKCGSATDRMIKEFPELKRVRGWYAGIEHWWCVDPNGEIVDPTYMQFGSDYNRAKYREFQEGVDPEPLGKCMNCGWLCWELDDDGEKIPGATSWSCSEDCAKSLESYYR